MVIGGDAVSAAARAIAREEGRHEVTPRDVALATAAVLAMAPVITRQERERIAGFIEPRKLSALAGWLALYHPAIDEGVLADLRQWSVILRDGKGAPQGIADALIEAAGLGGISAEVIREMRAGL